MSQKKANGKGAFSKVGCMVFIDNFYELNKQHTRISYYTKLHIVICGAADIAGENSFTRAGRAGCYFKNTDGWYKISDDGRHGTSPLD